MHKLCKVVVQHRNSASAPRLLFSGTNQRITNNNRFFHHSTIHHHNNDNNKNNNYNKNSGDNSPRKATMQQREDSPEYVEKQHFYRQFIQMYGRQAVRDALSQPEDVKFHAIHVSNRDKNRGIIPEILSIAGERRIPIKFYSDDRKLMIISRARNESIVQGIVADVKPAKKDLNSTVDAFIAAEKKQNWQQPLLANNDNSTKNEIVGNSVGRTGSEKKMNHNRPKGVLALDSVMTPKNVGVILRTVAASGIDACLLPAETEGQVSVFHPEVIRTSTGSVFRARTVRCERRKQMKTALCQLADDLNALILVLTPPKSSTTTKTETGNMNDCDDDESQQTVAAGDKLNPVAFNLFDLPTLLAHDTSPDSNTSGNGNNLHLSSHPLIVYVVGSETLGVSKEIMDLCYDDKYSRNFKQVYIPMSSNVESLNASSAATLCCYQHYQLTRS